MKNKAKIKKLLKEREEATNLIAKLLDGDLEKARKWMDTPTELLFGYSPTEAIFGGEGEAVIKWLKERSS